MKLDSFNPDHQHERKAIDRNPPAMTWPDLAINLYDRLTGRGAELAYEFRDFRVDVPSGIGFGESAPWKVNGTLRITTWERGSR